MARAVMNTVHVAGTEEMSTRQTPTPSDANSFRISSVVDRLLAYVPGGSRNDDTDFFNLCLSLARGIDYAIANNEPSVKAPDIPKMLKQVCQWRNDAQIQAAIMVLMLSIKNACRSGWFNQMDTEELHNLYNEIAGSYCSVRDINSEESAFNHSISAVMSRFYPSMKMGEIVAFVVATPGYGAYVKDFHITKNAKSSDKICLFVAQPDNTETSSCIISPQQVNFLLNGKDVDGRNCVYKDPGPQNPTVVTHMLKYGTNLLQAVGQFDGKYIIVVAFMSMLSNPSCPALPDYVPPAAAAPDSDNDIIEGPSRISLNCPISFTRIVTPVKGKLCKHLQCFDFDNYVGINSRRPSWRCAHCHQSVCFDDIRIDQNMVKILKEVSLNVSHVKFSADGSWEAVNEGDDHTNKPQDNPSLHQQATTSQHVGAEILDLTDCDDDTNVSNFLQESDKKPSPAQFQDQPNVNEQTLGYVNTNNWIQRVDLPIHATGTSSFSLNRTPVIDTGISQGQSQSQIPVSNNIHLQQYNSSNEHRRQPTHARHITRVPIAVQALPAQTSRESVNGDRQQESSRFHLSPHQMFQMISSAPPSQQNWVHHDRSQSQVSSQPILQFGAHSGQPQQSSGYQQHQSVNQMIPNTVHASVRLPPLVHQGGISDLQSNQQEACHFNMAAARQDHNYNMAAVAQQAQNYNLAAQQAQNYNSAAQQAQNYNLVAQQALNYNLASQQAPNYNMAQQAHNYNVAAAGQQAHRFNMAAAQQAIETCGLSIPVEQQGGQSQSLGFDAPPVDQNWQPSGRMRGSLSGQAFTDAYNQYMYRPTQPLQAARPPMLNTPRPVIPPHLQTLVANNRSAHGASGSNGGGGFA